MVDANRRFIFLGSRKGLFQGPLPPSVSVCRDRFEVEAAVSRPSRRVTWVSFTRRLTDVLLEKTVDLRADWRGSSLIALTPVRVESIPALVGLFQPAFGLVEGLHWLPTEELVEAITSDDASERFVGVSVDHTAKTLTFLRGDVEAVVAPFAIFQKSGDGTAPDFGRPRLTDYGRTVVLGEYEASSDAILYELDPDHRRRLRKRRRETERSFGAALLRLRKQKRLRRDDFAPISSKEIARLERGEIEKPRAKTLQTIADRLGVRAEEIEFF